MTSDDPSRSWFPSEPEPEPRRTSKQDIAEVLVRYASGIDRRDWDLFRSCFTSDCQADYGDIGSWESADAITDFMISAHTDMGHTMHRISNIAVDVDVDAGGERAVARSYVDGILMAPDAQSGFNPVGFYDDDLVRTGGGWRIARRTFTMVHFRTFH
ncbi:MAG TPA: nuclear transport factor 2 family protein [Acidimicrobiales bacterium]|jgi:3-phenylpropionate/cinnamic acid dioxygenase small subunit|nr:nuclear transport factor 2 family protein [Acidimicrobiales bacterium]